MMDQTLFKTHFAGKDGFVWWIGQVASEESWLPNFPSKPGEEAPGVGERYKVRIMGYHTAAPADLPDDALPWATVMYPVTAGGGGRGNYENSALVAGTFVFGFFLDGDDAQQPVIMGCLGYNDYAQTMTTLSQRKPFVPYSGYSVKDRTEIGPGNLKANPQPNPQEPLQNASDVTAETQTNNTSSPNTQPSKGDRLLATDSHSCSTLAQPSTDETQPLSGFQNSIREALKNVQNIQKEIQNASDEATGWIAEKQDEINTGLNLASATVSSIMRTIYNDAMEAALKEFNKATAPLLESLAPDEKQKAENALEIAAQEIKCLFKSLLEQLFKQIKSFILDAASRIVNVTQCYINNVVLPIIDNIKNLANGILNTASSVISSLTGGLAGLADVAIGVLGAIDGVFSLQLGSFCPDDSENNKSIVDQWCVGSGVKPKFELGSDMIDKVKSSVKDITGVVDDVTGFVGGIGDDIENIFDIGALAKSARDTCGEPLFEFCEPPQIKFNSKGGAGAVGNLIISSAGELLGVDMVDFGFGYSLKTRAVISSNCGQGRGGRVRPILGKVKKSKKVKVRKSKDPNSIDDEIVTSKNGGGLPGFNGGGPGGGGPGNDGSGGGDDESVIKKTGTSTDDYPGAGGLGGSVIKFELYESLNVNPRGFYPKGLGEFSNSIYGGAVNLWSSLSQSVQGFASLTGGSGTGFKVYARFQALAGAGGNPNNTAYAVLRVVDEGEGYKVGDILNFPDIVGIPISGGGDEFRLRILEVTQPDDTEETTGIVDAVVTNPGSGYLPRSDGSKGGDGRTWAEKDETLIVHDDDTFDPPTRPGLRKCFKVGDKVTLPVNTSATLEPSGQVLLGGVETIITEAGCITTPSPKSPDDPDDPDDPDEDGDGDGDLKKGIRGDYPGDGDGKYPVVLKLDDLIVEDSGEGYEDGDTIVIEPSFGAETDVSFDSQGRISKIRVINPGEGFNTMPDIYINTKTGYGAELLPRFGIDRIGKDREQDYDPEKVIQVIDCVGRFT
ncbi:hypothetical protein OAA11_01750 [Schleiferiaceae bacterium]|nr:hypothetical protein [Schleiferiaceae bacterium]